MNYIARSTNPRKVKDKAKRAGRRGLVGRALWRNSPANRIESGAKLMKEGLQLLQSGAESRDSQNVMEHDIEMALVVINRLLRNLAHN